jgi:hypothetical protein
MTAVNSHAVAIGSILVGAGHPLVLIGGPCAIENERHALMTAERLAAIAAARGVPFVYKSSYDKANRSSARSYRGPGLREGLRILRRVKDAVGVPVLSDVHEVEEVGPAAEVLDVLQIPAFSAVRPTSRSRRARASPQRQEGTIPGAPGHGQCRRQGASRREPIDPARSGARRSVTTTLW